MIQAKNAHDAADEVFAAKAQQAINGVLADPTEGPDSSVYEAMGYTARANANRASRGEVRAAFRHYHHTPKFWSAATRRRFGMRRLAAATI